jgi:hypothetical protein
MKHEETIERNPPGFLKRIVPIGKPLTYEGKVYKPRNPTAHRPEDRFGDVLEISQEETRYLVGTRLAELCGGAYCEVQKYADNFPSFTSWHFASRPDDAFVRAIYLQPFELVHYDKRPPGFKLRIYPREVISAGGYFRYCSQAELTEFLKTGDVGTDGLDAKNPWPSHVTYKILAPNPKRRTPDDRKFSESIQAQILASQRAESARRPWEQAAGSSGWNHGH